MATVQKGREQLQAVVEPLPTDLPDEHTGLESMYESDETRGLRPGRPLTSDIGRLHRSVRRNGPAAILAGPARRAAGRRSHRRRSTPVSRRPVVPGRKQHERTPHRRRRPPAPTPARAVRCTSRRPSPTSAARRSPASSSRSRLDLVLERVPDGIVARGTRARPRGRASAALPAPELAADLDVGVRRALRARTRSRARPTRSRATRSTSSSWCATPCCSSCPLAPAVPTTDCAPAPRPACGVGAARPRSALRPRPARSAVGALLLRRSTSDTTEHQEHPMAVPKRKTPRAKTAPAARLELAPRRAGALDLPELRRGQAAAHRVRQLRLVRRPPGDRRRVAAAVPITDRRRRDGRRPRARRDRRGRGRGRRRARRARPARRAARPRSAPLPARRRPSGVELVADHRGHRDATSPPASVRTQEGRVDRASPPRRVRDGEADAMVSAGNTGATMAAALLRMGRIRGVARPAIAVPIPVPVARAADPGRRRRDGRLHAGVAGAVRRAWAASTPGIRLGVDEPTRRPAVERRGGRARATTCARQTYALLDGDPGLHRQRRGPRLHARHRRRDRHRRLHRQRRAEDGRGRDPRHRRARVRHARRPRPRRRRPPTS